MAKAKETGAGPLLIGLGIAAGVGAIALIARAFRPPVAFVAEGVDAAKTGLETAAQVVADAIFNVQGGTEIVEATNVVVSEAQRQIDESDNELERLRLRLVQLEAARAEAEALGNIFALEPSVQQVETQIAILEATGGS